MNRSEKRMDAEKVLKTIYAVLMVFLLLEYLWQIASYESGTFTPVPVQALRLISTGLALRLTRGKKDLPGILMWVYLVLIFVRAFIGGGQDIFINIVCEELFAGIWAFGGCYSLGRILNEKELKRLLLIFVSVWTAGMFASSVTGIAAAWNSIKIPNVTGTSWWMLRGKKNSPRLNLVYQATTSGSVMGFSVVMAAIAAACVKKKYAKILFALSVIPMVLAMCLTGTRSAQIGCGTALGAAAGLLVLSRIKRSKFRWPAALAAGALVLGITVLALQQVTPAFNSVKARGGLVISRALAESGSADYVPVAVRGFAEDDVTTGRVKIWSAVLRYLGEHPLSLLTGESVYEPLAAVRQATGLSSHYAHCHNVLLQVLLESGIPGLALVLGFIGIITVRAVRLTLDVSKPLLFRLIPVLILSVCVAETVECFTWFHAFDSPVVFFFFTALGIASAPGKGAGKTGA